MRQELYKVLLSCPPSVALRGEVHVPSVRGHIELQERGLPPSPATQEEEGLFHLSQMRGSKSVQELLLLDRENLPLAEAATPSLQAGRDESAHKGLMLKTPLPPPRQLQMRTPLGTKSGKG